jgi:hypothetical protein
MWTLKKFVIHQGAFSKSAPVEIFLSNFLKLLRCCEMVGGFRLFCGRFRRIIRWSERVRSETPDETRYSVLYNKKRLNYDLLELSICVQ